MTNRGRQKDILKLFPRKKKKLLLVITEKSYNIYKWNLYITYLYTTLPS
jgi:hypothetical protein